MQTFDFIMEMKYGTQFQLHTITIRSFGPIKHVKVRRRMCNKPSL